MGYTTQAVSKDTYYLIGTQFQKVGDAATSATFNDILKMNGIEPTSWKNRGNGAEILVNTAKGYDHYYYTDEAYVEDIDDEVVGWTDSKGDYATQTLNLGEGFWLRTPATTAEDASITVAGQVLKDSSKPIEFAAGYSILCNPLPVGVDLSKVVMTGLTPVSWKNRGTGAEILVNTAKGYDHYYYTDEAYVEDIDDEVEGWTNSKGDLATGITVKAGESFWMNSPWAGSIKFAD